MLNQTAAMALAVRRLADEGFRPTGDLVSVPDEECGGLLGAKLVLDSALDLVRTDYALTEVGGAVRQGPVRRIMEGGFRPWPRYTVALDVDPEFVITTDPRPNTALATDLVVIWVSEGPGPPPEPVVPRPDKPIDVPIPPGFLEPKPKS